MGSDFRRKASNPSSMNYEQQSTLIQKDIQDDAAYTISNGRAILNLNDSFLSTFSLSMPGTPRHHAKEIYPVFLLLRRTVTAEARL
jgi:hypothetical protein